MHPDEYKNEKSLSHCPAFIDPAQGDRLLGAFRAVCGIKGVDVLVHAPVGCHWGVNFIERLSTMKTNATLSALRERSVIFGGEESLRKTIQILLKKRKHRYLVLLAGNVPSIVGEDWQGVIQDVGFNLNAITVDCGGFLGKMGNGYDACLAELCAWMTDPGDLTTPPWPTVNLIGVQWDYARAEADINELRRILKLVGIGVNAVIPPTSLAELKKAPAANLNIVFGYGTQLARRMQEQWGIGWIPYPQYPYGVAGTRDFLQHVAIVLGMDDPLTNKRLQREEAKVLKALRMAQVYLPALYELPVVLAADLLQARGLAVFLSGELGMQIGGIHVTSAPDAATGSDELETRCPNVVRQTSWERLGVLTENMDVRLMLGSDLDQRMAREQRIPLILIAYPSTSRICLTPLPYMGFGGVPTLVEEIVNAVVSTP